MSTFGQDVKHELDVDPADSSSPSSNTDSRQTDKTCVTPTRRGLGDVERSERADSRLLRVQKGGRVR